MKKELLTAALFLGTLAASAQVGIGTLTPNKSAQLDVEATDKGILIPRVSLQSITDATTITNGNVNSLLVFNTNTQNDVAPGYYYWYEDKWLRIVNNDDLVALDQNTKNVLLSVVGDELVLQDSDNDTVTVPLSQINILTNIVDNNDGTFTYTNEAGTAVTISIPASVINNIQTILGDTNVLNELIEVLGDTYVGGNVYYDGTQFTYVDQSGATHIINFEDIVQANETVTTIVKNTDGTYTYTNEADATFVIDVPASVVEQFENIYNQIVNEEIVVNGDTYNTFEEYLTHIANEAVTINGGDMITVTGTGTATDPYMVNIDKGTANSMLITNAAGELEWATIEDIVQANETVTTIVKNTNGTYTYTNEADATFVIDVPASVVEQFENIYNQIVNEEIVVNGDTYNTFEEYLTHIANEAVTINGGDMITVTGTGTATDPYMVNIDKGTANSMLITNAAGELEWATIEDIVQANETVTTIVKNTNGTYTYTNEADATFVIDVPASVIEQFENIYNQIVNEEIVVNGDTYNTFEEYLTHIANEAVTINGGDMITVTGTGTATDPYMVNIDKGTANSMLITNAAGELEWATIEDIVQANETVTTIVKNTNGTYTYTNEADATFVIDVPASVVEQFENIYNQIVNEEIVVNGDTYNTFEEYLTHIANEAVTINGGDMITVTGTGTATDPYMVNIDKGTANSMLITNAAGELEWATIEDIVQANETVTTIVKNTDGTYTYTNEADATFVIDVPASVVEQFENIYNQIVNEEIVVNGDTYNTFEEYLTHIANEAVTINGGDMITVTGTGTATDPYMVNIDKGTANSMLITNAAGELEWATIEDIVQANETVTTIVKNTDGTYTYTNEADATFVIDVPASVVEQFENIYNQIVNEEIVVNGDTYNTFEEYLTHIANEAVTINGGDMITVTGTGTATDPYMVNIDKGTANSMLITNAAGELEWATIEDIVQANETVTTIVKNTDGTYTYTNEADATFVIDVPASVVEQFENIYNQIVNEEIVVNGDTYNTFEEYLTHIANEAVTINGGDMITVTGTGTATDPYMVNIDKGTANSMLITNAAGELEWASIEDIVQGVQKTVTIIDGMNTTVDANVSGNNTEYKVNVATAKGADGTTAANLGVVKEAMVNPSVSVSQAGELSVNLESLNAIKEVNVSYNAILDDAILLGNANTGDITITLPDAVGNKGKKFTIKKQDSNEDYYVNVVGSINGLSQLYTALPHSGWELVSDGTTWKITNKF